MSSAAQCFRSQTVSVKKTRKSLTTIWALLGGADTRDSSERGGVKDIRAGPATNSLAMPASLDEVRSPLVGHSDPDHDSRALVGTIEKYLVACRDHQVSPCPDVLIRLRLRHERLCIQPPSGSRFGDLDLVPLVELLEDAEGAHLQAVRSLDFSCCRLGPSGAMLVAKLLLHPSCCLEELNLSGQRLGPDGALALMKAIRASNTLQKVYLHTCGLGAAGGLAFVELLADEHHSLKLLDLQNNFIPFHTCEMIRAQGATMDLVVDLTGNRVLDEVLNAISHGLGVVLAVVGTVFIGIAVNDKPSYYKMAIVPYCISLIVLYLASTLYHSFHALGPTVVHIFAILDHTAIYMLIAGSYTPFLGILFPGEMWAKVVLGGMWGTALIGVMLTSFYHGPFKTPIELVLYLLMGWAAVGCLKEMLAKLSHEGAALLIVGGVLYTIGVPWFVRNAQTCGIPDHTLWHVFVLGASISHYFCIYWDVVGA